MTVKRLAQILRGRFRAASARLAVPATVETADNRFLAARNEFSNAFGDLARGKRNWQLVAFALCGLLGIVMTGYVRLAGSARVVPYVVEVDRLGTVVAVGSADEMKIPDQRLVAAQLAQFIRSIRTVLPAAAAAAEAEILRRGYAFAGPEAAGFLNAYFANPTNDPRALGARLTRDVDVTAVLRIPRSNVWRLEWSETTQTTDAPPERSAWEGYVTVKLVAPATAEVVEENPLGVYVTSLNWTRLSGHRTASTDSGVSQ